MAEAITHHNDTKNISYYARRVVGNPAVRSIAKFLRINVVGKKLYFALFAPKDLKVSHTIAGVTVQFYVKNYTELTYLTQTLFGVGDERHIITYLIEHFKPGDVFYDVGSFLGVHAVFAAKSLQAKGGRVVAFEPSPYSYEALKNNIALNQLDNVTVINAALGKEAGVGVMGGTDMSMYSLKDCLDERDASQKITIMAGDSAVQEKNLPKPNVVKIDVEGYEYFVLQGLEQSLKNPNCRIVCCEVHPTMLPPGVDAQEVIELLRHVGFTKIKTSFRGDTFHAICQK